MFGFHNKHHHVTYSDEILPLGLNLKLTTINNLKKSEINECLDMIIPLNKDIQIDRIQYSENKESLYIYANKVLNVEKWDDRHIKRYKLLTSNIAVLEELKKIIVKDENVEPIVTSLYDLMNLIKQKETESKEILKKYEKECTKEVVQKYGDHKEFVIYNYDSKNGEVRTGFGDWRKDQYETLIFGLDNGNIVIKNKTHEDNNQLLELLSDRMDAFFKEIADTVKLDQVFNFKFRVVNSKLDIEYTNSGVVISHREKTNNEFVSDTLNIIRGNEDLLFKKLNIKISDCPKWSQKELYDNKQKEIEEIEKQRRKPFHGFGR